MINKISKYKKHLILTILTFLYIMIPTNTLASQNINDESYILTDGSYDESYPYLTYNGSWKNAFSSKYENGAIKYCDEANSSVEFTFEGSIFKWYGTKANVRGNAKIYIDNTLAATINCYAYPSQYHELLYQSDPLENSIHRVKIVSCEFTNPNGLSSHNIDIDEIFISDDSTSSTLETGTYKQDDDNLLYVGNWVPSITNSFNVKQSRDSSLTESKPYVEFIFNGRAFEWYGTKSKTRGYADIYIDNTKVNNEPIDCYSSESQFNTLIYRSSELSYGPHKIKIVSTGNKNSSAASSDIDISQISIIKNINSLILKHGSYEDTNRNLAYYGNWTISFSNNYSAKSLKVAKNKNAFVEFSFNGTSFEWYGTKSLVQGSAKIFVDDKEVSSVDCYNNSTLYNTLLYKSDEFTNGVHKVRIYADNSKTIDVDRIKIN